MHLNWVERALMNNPLRAAVQRHVEARRLLRLGGAAKGATALELGCGRGIGVEIILDLFGAEHVDAFDLDPRMTALARRRLRGQAERVHLWIGDAASIPVEDSRYQAVFDFGIIHHMPRWRHALTEVHRVLRPGGRFYAEEAFDRLITHPIWRRVVTHPQRDRFDHERFRQALAEAGLRPVASSQLWGGFGWFVADKPMEGGKETGAG
jgi:ubiquinone/menaquinone biosynthesis C-methylase UbiE